MSNEWQLSLLSVMDKITTIETGGQSRLNDFDHLVLLTALVERLESMAESLEHLVRILDARLGAGRGV